jgi:Family of unknown function (DUF6159)
MFERMRRSWELVQAAGAVLREDPRLLALPLLSAICAAVVIATFVAPLSLADGTDGNGGWLYLWLLLLYTALYAVGIFFNTALVAIALVRLAGGAVGIRDGLALAAARLGRIGGYALIAATVGVLLRALEERVGWIGRLVVGALGVAWSAATFLVVPILATRDLSAPAAITESSRLLKSTWGENVTGNLGIGAVFFIGYLLLLIGAGAGAMLFASLGQQVLAFVWIGLCVVAAVIAALWQSALQAIYAAALYRYATDGATGLRGDLLERAFTPRH